jgi:hypothetical protein
MEDLGYVFNFEGVKNLPPLKPKATAAASARIITRKPYI